LPQGEKWDAPSNQKIKLIGWAVVTFVLLTLLILAVSGGDIFLPWLLLKIFLGIDSDGNGFSGGGGLFDGGGSSSDW
jgi:nitrate reductase NapE component